MSLDAQIIKPTLLLNAAIARANIARMAAKARAAGVRLRPHFKTHQSAEIGGWFREHGVTAITVSSVDMAAYFADHGWDDITLAFPVNLRQLPAIADLARRVRLGLLVESVEVVQALANRLDAETAVWLKIDAGYGRTGLAWQDAPAIAAVARAVAAAPRLRLAGLLTHAGNTYAARGRDAVAAIHHETMGRLQSVQRQLAAQGQAVQISIGDTPACSLLDDFGGVDEIRPGNFVFYDVMQAEIGACSLAEIAVAAACPVVARHPAQRELVLYGGAVHLSKEGLRQGDGSTRYGRLARLTPTGWNILPPENYVRGLSQEHGIVAASAALLAETAVGDLLLVLPVHSCLTANLLKRYLTLDGTWIAMSAA